MTLDRSWLRRGLVSPPRWGRSVPDIWADTKVTFIRNEPGENSTGSTSLGSPTEYGSIDANVSIDDQINMRTGNDAIAGSEASGPIRRRMYLVIFDPSELDAWPDFRPRKGDRMRFQDPRFGAVPITINVESAIMPTGSADHWEVESEEFE